MVGNKKSLDYKFRLPADRFGQAEDKGPVRDAAICRNLRSTNAHFAITTHSDQKFLTRMCCNFTVRMCTAQTATSYVIANEPKVIWKATPLTSFK